MECPHCGGKLGQNDSTLDEVIATLFVLLSRQEVAIKTIQEELRNHDIIVYLPSLYEPKIATEAPDAP